MLLETNIKNHNTCIAHRGLGGIEFKLSIDDKAVLENYLPNLPRQSKEFEHFGEVYSK